MKTSSPTLQNHQLSPAERRRLMIDICKRRIKPGTGSSYELLMSRTAMNPWPDLRPISKGVRWLIVGAVATRAYTPERATKDLDILIHPEDQDAALAQLQNFLYSESSMFLNLG